MNVLVKLLVTVLIVLATVRLFVGEEEFRALMAPLLGGAALETLGGKGTEMTDYVVATEQLDRPANTKDLPPLPVQKDASIVENIRPVLEESRVYRHAGTTREDTRDRTIKEIYDELTTTVYKTLDHHTDVTGVTGAGVAGRFQAGMEAKDVGSTAFDTYRLK